MTPQILSDSFEAIAELGGQATSQTKKAAVSIIKKAVNEMTADKVFAEKAEGGKVGNHTPLDAAQMKKLEDSYQKQDQQKEAKHKVEDEQKMGEVKMKLNSFFREYKQKEETFHEQKKQEEAMKKRHEEEEKAAKKQEEEQKKQSAVVAPKGKVRRNIFQRAVKSSQAETRVGSGGK